LWWEQCPLTLTDAVVPNDWTKVTDLLFQLPWCLIVAEKGAIHANDDSEPHAAKFLG